MQSGRSTHTGSPAGWLSVDCRIGGTYEPEAELSSFYRMSETGGRGYIQTVSELKGRG